MTNGPAIRLHGLPLPNLQTLSWIFKTLRRCISITLYKMLWNEGSSPGDSSHPSISLAVSSFFPLLKGTILWIQVHLRHKENGIILKGFAKFWNLNSVYSNRHFLTKVPKPLQNISKYITSLFLTLFAFCKIFFRKKKIPILEGKVNFTGFCPSRD